MWQDGFGFLQRKNLTVLGGLQIFEAL